MSDRFARVQRALREHPWAILPSVFEAILDVVELRAAGGRYSAEEVDARIGGPKDDRPTVSRVGSVAVLPLHGVLSQRMSLLTQISGGTSTEIFGQQLAEALADPDVQAIVLDIDSPGGSVYGVEELAQQVYRARSQKPIVAVADSVAASAAYWIGSQAGEFDVTPSGQVGSVGVVTTHTDVSGNDSAAGVKRTVLAIPPGKAQGHPYEPLSDESRDGILASMAPYYELFTKAISRGRGVSVKDVKDGYGQGRMLAASPALAAGMVDRIDTLANVVARLNTPAGRRAVLSPHASEAARATTDQEPITATSQESRTAAPWRELLKTECDTL